ncbi:MAG: hypothetical protein ACLVKB_02710 [Agathobacter rectalis]
MGNQIYKEISKFAEMQRDEIKREKAKKKRKAVCIDPDSVIGKEIMYQTALLHEILDEIRGEKAMTKEELLILEKILEKIDKADEMNCKKEEEYNSFCTNTREDWNEEQYQKLKREKILTEASYLASLAELKAEVKNMLNQ